MRVSFLYYEDCPSYDLALERLREVMDEEGIPNEVEVIKVESEEQARKLRFVGSPTIHVNGQDIDPSSDSRYTLTCRAYRLAESRALRSCSSSRTPTSPWRSPPAATSWRPERSSTPPPPRSCARTRRSAKRTWERCKADSSQNNYALVCGAVVYSGVRLLVMKRSFYAPSFRLKQIRFRTACSAVYCSCAVARAFDSGRVARAASPI